MIIDDILWGIMYITMGLIFFMIILLIFGGLQSNDKTDEVCRELGYDKSKIGSTIFDTDYCVDGNRLIEVEFEHPFSERPKVYIIGGTG